MPYHKGTWTSETEDSNYNVVQDQDPQGLASNYVAKPIPLFPTGELANDQTYINVVAIDGAGSGNTSFVVVDQRSGTMYYVGHMLDSVMDYSVLMVLNMAFTNTTNSYITN